MLRDFLRACIVFATLALPSTVAHAQTQPCDDLSVGHTPPALLAQSVQPNTAIVCRRVYIAMQSLDARVPLWSAEHLTDEALEQRIGIDPFPSLSLQIHNADPALPQPEISPYTPRSRSTGAERRALIDPMLRGFSRRF